MLTESTEEAREIRLLVITLFLMKPFVLLIEFTGLEMYGHSLFPSQEEVWLDLAQAWNFKILMHPLHSLPTSCLHWPLRKKWNPHWIPGFVISWFQEKAIVNNTGWGWDLCKPTEAAASEQSWRDAAVVLLAVKSGLTYSCSVLCVVCGPPLGLITIQTSWAKKAFFINISLLPLIETFCKYYYASMPTSSVKHIWYLI